jgi:hypothetical protein
MVTYGKRGLLDGARGRRAHSRGGGGIGNGLQDVFSGIGGDERRADGSGQQQRAHCEHDGSALSKGEEDE